MDMHKPTTISNALLVHCTTQAALDTSKLIITSNVSWMHYTMQAVLDMHKPTTINSVQQIPYTMQDVLDMHKRIITNSALTTLSMIAGVRVIQQQFFNRIVPKTSSLVHSAQDSQSLWL
jgi:hypothetical protein